MASITTIETNQGVNAVNAMILSVEQEAPKDKKRLTSDTGTQYEVALAPDRKLPQDGDAPTIQSSKDTQRSTEPLSSPTKRQVNQRVVVNWDQETSRWNVRELHPTPREGKEDEIEVSVPSPKKSGNLSIMSQTQKCEPSQWSTQEREEPHRRSTREPIRRSTKEKTGRFANEQIESTESEIHLQSTTTYFNWSST